MKFNDMIKRVEILSESSELFGVCWELYVSAFPEQERREMEYQLATMARSDYRFEAVMDGDKFIGILGWWQFEKFRYVEHFAISSEIRSGGYGARVLAAFIEESTRPVLLEVEHPIDDLTNRRIGFYQRLGFVLNEHYYAHPPYRGDEFVELMIMTYKNPISTEELETFKAEAFPKVHFLRYNQ